MCLAPVRHGLEAGVLAGATAALALLGGCSGGAPRKGSGAPPAATQQTALERYSAYAGPPVDRITWLGRFYSWEQLGRDRLLVFTTPTDAYLLKVWPSCDLRWVVSTIAVSSTGPTVTARLDAVIIDSAPTGRMVCPIEEIRPLDYRRMLADRRAAAQGSAAAPPTQPDQR